MNPCPKCGAFDRDPVYGTCAACGADMSESDSSPYMKDEPFGWSCRCNLVEHTATSEHGTSIKWDVAEGTGDDD